MTGPTSPTTRTDPAQRALEFLATMSGTLGGNLTGMGVAMFLVADNPGLQVIGVALVYAGATLLCSLVYARSLQAPDAEVGTLFLLRTADRTSQVLLPCVATAWVGLGYFTDAWFTWRGGVLIFIATVCLGWLATRIGRRG